MSCKKIGLDIHGVIDADVEFFRILTRTLVGSGFEVHILTGPSESLVIPKLREWGVVYTHIFSIVDFYTKQGETIKYDEVGNPWMEDVLWNRAKGEYCWANDIRLHLDNTKRYGDYFRTPFALYNEGQL